MLAETTRIRVELEPIVITYDGLDAEAGAVDMMLLAKSMEGYGRILATTATFATTLTYHRHMDSMPIRVQVQEAQPGSFKLFIILEYARQAGLMDVNAMYKAVLDWVTKLLSRKPEDKLNELHEPLMKALELNGQMQEAQERNAEWLRGTIDRMSQDLIPAAKKATSPIGESCSTVTLALGQEAITVWDESDKQNINEKVRPAIQPASTYDVFITELDIETGSAKISFSDQDDHRIRARITDPMVNEPENAYAMALANQLAVRVRAKAEILDGEIIQIHISDTDV